MSEPYVGEIRMFAGNFAPLGWGFCDGSLVPIAEYETLFNLVGTTYGGDGQETFALPDLRGRIPIHFNNSYPLGAMGGVEQVTITSQTMPAHTHPMIANASVANSPNVQNNYLGMSSQVNAFYGDPVNITMNPGSLQPAGNTQPHENMMPFLCVNFIISFYGIYPSPA